MTRDQELDTGDLVNDRLYNALDKLYERGWVDRNKGRDYDPRGTQQWQDVLDLFRLQAAKREPVVVGAVAYVHEMVIEELGRMKGPSECDGIATLLFTEHEKGRVALFTHPPSASDSRDANNLEALVSQLNADEDYLWSWHCNIAMAAHDEGLSHSAANRAASRFLSAIGCNSEKIKYYAETQKPEPFCKIVKALGEIAGYYHDGPYRHDGIIGHIEAAISLINHIEHKKQLAEDAERAKNISVAKEPT